MRHAKRIITRSNVTPGNVPGMSADDLSWTRLPDDAWERVRWARRLRFKSGEEAATALGMKPGTYRAYERAPTSSKTIDLNYDHAVLFGRKFGVRWEWLLNNEGTPWPSETPASRAAKMIEAQPADRQEELVTALELLLKRAG